MTPAQAGQLQQQLRRLRKRGVIDPAAYCVADILLWLFRKPGQREARASIMDIVRESGVKRTAVVAALRRLRELGAFERLKRRLRVFWGHNRQLIASRQDKNVYRFAAPSTEVAGRPVNRQESILSERPALLEAALGSLGSSIAAGGTEKWLMNKSRPPDPGG